MWCEWNILFIFLVTGEEQQKLQQEYLDYQKKLEQQKADYRKEHPDAVRCYLILVFNFITGIIL